MLGFRKFFDGIRLISKTTLNSDSKGELEVKDSNGELYYHNGTTESLQLTENNISGISESKLPLTYPTQTLYNTQVSASILSGVPLNATNLGPFVGTVLGDSLTIKDAIQTLDSYIENGGLLDLTHLVTSIIPNTDVYYNLGTDSKRFLSVSALNGNFGSVSSTIASIGSLNVTGTTITTVGSISQLMADTLTVNSVSEFKGQAYSSQQSITMSGSSLASVNWNLGNACALNLDGAVDGTELFINGNFAVQKIADFDATATYSASTYVDVGNYATLDFGSGKILYIAETTRPQLPTSNFAVTTNSVDTLAISGTNPVTISLAKTTASKNTAALIQSGIQALGGNFTIFKVTATAAYVAAPPISATIASTPLVAMEKLFIANTTVTGAATLASLFPPANPTQWTQTVKENWTYGTGWSYGSTAVAMTSVSTVAPLDQLVSLIDKVVYKITFDVTTAQAGQFVTPCLFDNSHNVVAQGTAQTCAATGTFVQYLVATATTVRAGLLHTNGVASGVIDNLSIKPTVTLNMSNPKAGATYFVKIINASTPKTNLLFSPKVLWSGSSIKDLTGGSGAIDSAVLYYDGSNYLCTMNFSYSNVP